MGIVQTDLNGKVLNYFNSVNEASKTLGISRSLIYGCLQGRAMTTHHFQFFDADDFCNAMDEPSKEVFEDEPEEEEVKAPVHIRFRNGICVCIPPELVQEVWLPEVPGHTSMEYQPAED